MEDPYGKRLRHAAREDFSRYWSGHRWLGWIAAAVVSILSGIWLHGVNVAKYIDILPALVLLLTIILSYLYSRRKGAEALDTGLRERISARESTIETLNSSIETLQSALKQPAVTKHELDARPRVRDLLEGAERGEIDVLRFLIDHGDSLSDYVYASNKGTAVGRAINRWRHNLIHENVEHGTNRTFWSITPGLHEALTYVLHEDSSGDSEP
jgi:hypothetical protein